MGLRKWLCGKFLKEQNHQYALLIGSVNAKLELLRTAERRLYVIDNDVYHMHARLAVLEDRVKQLRHRVYRSHKKGRSQELVYDRGYDIENTFGESEDHWNEEI